MYAGCVHWPFSFEPRTGVIAAAVIIGLSLLDIGVKTAKRLAG